MLKESELKAYISGKISGESNGNKTAFKSVEMQYERFFNIINPHKICETVIKLSPSQDDEEIWKSCMSICLKELVNCDLVLALDDWHKSKGAKIEIFIAQQLGKKIILASSGAELKQKLHLSIKNLYVEVMKIHVNNFVNK